MRTQFLAGTIVLSFALTNIAQAIQVPVSVDLGNLAVTSADIKGANLKTWRGTFGFTNNLTFQYLTSGTNLPYPDRNVVKDGTANNQNYLWSDQILEIVYRPSNVVNSAVLMYTNNKEVSPADPLASVALRGGLVGGTQCDTSTMADISCGDRASVLPLIWKVVTLDDMGRANGATIGVPNSLVDSPAGPNPFHMPTYIANYGQAVDAGDVYAGAGRASTKDSGFNDYSTHFVLDVNNKDPNNLWWSNYTDGPSGKSGKAFRYSSLAGAWGLNTTEAGLGGGGRGVNWAVFGGPDPAYYLGEILIGLGTANALVASYSTNIYVDQVSF